MAQLPAAAKRSLAASSTPAAAAAERNADAAAGSGSGSDSEEHDGFVKVDWRKTPAEPQLAAFKPTIPPTGIPMFAPIAGAKGSRLISRVRGTLRPSAPAAAPRSPAPQPAKDAGGPASPRTPTGPKDAAQAGEGDSSCSDDEISDVLDETEIQLIEAMEDARIAGLKSRGPDLPDAPGPAAPATGLLQRRPLRWVGLGESDEAPRSSFAESLKERFSASKAAGASTSIPTLRAATGNEGAKGREQHAAPDKDAPAAPEASVPPAAPAASADAASPDAVQFVAPGVAKQTASSLLRRVLDIDAPVIQQKMVEFLLIDGVIASLIGFVTHCQGSIYSPTSTTPSAPSSPQTSHSAGMDHPPGAVHEAEQRRLRRARLLRQRNRSSGLSETDLRRGYNAVHMLVRDDAHAHRVLEAKLSVVVPCLMAVFHTDSLGSFHHACMLLEHCFALSPLKTTRLLLYQQNPPSRWWQHSESVAKGHAPICDVLPYLSEPCVQRLFLKAEFGVWTGRLMVSLGLKPNDAMVVSDELSRIGLGSFASALGPAPDDDSTAGKAQSQQRSKAMQLVRNRFQQLNRGGFLTQALELIEDPDPSTSEGAAEFLAFMINDCSTFYGFNILFKPIYDSELPVRRLAQLIVNSPSQRLSLQAKSAIRLLHALLSKTSCQYGLRTREAQGMRDQELHPRGSQVMVHIGHAVRAALESFLPGLLATVAGQQQCTDLTSHSACNRRASAQSLQLPEYDEAERELDVDLTEAASSLSASDNESSDGSADSDRESPMPPLDLGERQPLPPCSACSGCEQLSDSSDRDSDDGHKDADLRSSAAALLQATYPESIASGSVSSSLSPSSTLSASPMAIASTTPERPLDTRATERMDAEDLDLLATLPKPDLPRLNLLRVCIEVLRECEDVDEVIGWVDLRVWRALGAWFVGHPHNNLLHMSVYQLLSIVTLEAVRLRRARRMQQGPWPRAPPPPPPAETATKPGQASLRRLHKLHDTGGRVGSRSGASAAEAGGYLSADAQSSGAPEPTAQLVAKRRALRRRAVAERLRREEASSCDNVLTYLVEQLRWIDKLIRRAASPNFDGAHGYISLILNTLRLAVQVDRRRCFSAAAPGKAAALSGAAQHAQAEADGMQSEDSDSEAILPDLAYHDPATRERLSEYPLYRLQRWEISLLYSPAFRAHLRALRRQALLTARKIVEFRLCDQMHRVISSESDGTGKRPVPFFSPQKVRPPQLLDNADLKKKQMQINVGLLLGSRCAAALSPSSSKASSSAAPAPTPGPTTAKNAAHEAHPIDEIGINLDSLYARMLGFTEDLVRPVPPPPTAGNRSASKGDSVAVAEAYLAAGADAATDEEDSEHDARTRKCSAGGYSKAGSARRKKSRPAATMPGTGLFEDMAPESAADAAEAICSALVGDGCAAPATSRHAPCVRGRKKAVAATGSVRRRRARLQRRSSASSLTGAPNSSQASPSIAPAAVQTEAPDSPLLPPADVAAPAAVGLSQSMQSLDLEQ